MAQTAGDPVLNQKLQEFRQGAWRAQATRHMANARSANRRPDPTVARWLTTMSQNSYNQAQLLQGLVPNEAVFIGRRIYVASPHDLVPGQEPRWGGSAQYYATSWDGQENSRYWWVTNGKAVETQMLASMMWWAAGAKAYQMAMPVRNPDNPHDTLRTYYMNRIFAKQQIPVQVSVGLLDEVYELAKVLVKIVRAGFKAASEVIDFAIGLLDWTATGGTINFVPLPIYEIGVLKVVTVISGVSLENGIDSNFNTATGNDIWIQDEIMTYDVAQYLRGASLYDRAGSFATGDPMGDPADLAPLGSGITPSTGAVASVLGGDLNAHHAYLAWARQEGWTETRRRPIDPRKSRWMRDRPRRR